METEVSKGTRSMEPPMVPSSTFDTPQQIQKPGKISEEK